MCGYGMTWFSERRSYASLAFSDRGEGGRALFLTANDRVLRVLLVPGWQG